MTVPNFKLWEKITGEDKKYTAQEGYCYLNQLPIFIDNDGKCYSCGKNIWDKITKEDAGAKHITSCPHCNCSYIE